MDRPWRQQENKKNPSQLCVFVFNWSYHNNQTTKQKKTSSSIIRPKEDLPSALSLVHHKRQEHIEQHHACHEQRVDRLQEMSVEYQLRDRQHTVQQMHRVVTPAAQGCGDGAIAEQGPEDDGDDDMECDHGAV